MMAENTTLIAYHAGIRVLDNGSVQSFTGRILSQWLNRLGYWMVSFSAKGKKYNVTVHRLVAYKKFGDAMFASGIECRHLDGNPQNNHPDNLALGTHSDNMMDIPRPVRQAKAAKSQRKYSDEVIAEWRKLHASGVSQEEISKRYRVTFRIIGYYVSRTASHHSWANPHPERMGKISLQKRLIGSLVRYSYASEAVSCQSSRRITIEGRVVDVVDNPNPDFGLDTMVVESDEGKNYVILSEVTHIRRPGTRWREHPRR